MKPTIAIVTLLTLATLARAEDLPAQPGYVKGEFIYETAPFPSCHASTGLFLTAPRIPSGNRLGGDQVLPPSTDDIIIPHHAVGLGPTL